MNWSRRLRLALGLAGMGDTNVLNWARGSIREPGEKAWARYYYRSRFISAPSRRPEDPTRGCGQRESLPPRSWPGLRTALAGSPVGLAESSLRRIIFMTLRYGWVVHLRRPPTPCYHDAVAIGHRRVNFRLTGTSTPQCGRLHRRTSAGILAGEIRVWRSRRQGCRRSQGYTLPWPPVLRHGTGARHQDHRVLRSEQPSDASATGPFHPGLQSGPARAPERS